MPHKIPEPVTANELIQFFPLDMEENKLEQLAEHINYQMEVAQGAIEIDKHTIENWEVYQAIQTIKNAVSSNDLRIIYISISRDSRSALRCLWNA